MKHDELQPPAARPEPQEQEDSAATVSERPVTPETPEIAFEGAER